MLGVGIGDADDSNRTCEWRSWNGFMPTAKLPREEDARLGPELLPWCGSLSIKEFVEAEHDERRKTQSLKSVHVERWSVASLPKTADHNQPQRCINWFTFGHPAPYPSVFALFACLDCVVTRPVNMTMTRCSA